MTPAPMSPADVELISEDRLTKIREAVAFMLEIGRHRDITYSAVTVASLIALVDQQATSLRISDEARVGAERQKGEVEDWGAEQFIRLERAEARIKALSATIKPFVEVASELPDDRVISETHPEWRRCLRRFKAKADALTVRQFRDILFALSSAPAHEDATPAIAEQEWEAAYDMIAGGITVLASGNIEIDTDLPQRLATLFAKSDPAHEGALAKAAGEPVADTGHMEADRLIDRLMSADPDFDDCQDAALLIRKLVIEHKGPHGYATWKDAAIAERLCARTATPEKEESHDG